MPRPKLIKNMIPIDRYDANLVSKLWDYFRITDAEMLKVFPVISKSTLDRIDYIEVAKTYQENQDIYSGLRKVFINITLNDERFVELLSSYMIRHNDFSKQIMIMEEKALCAKILKKPFYST